MKRAHWVTFGRWTAVALEALVVYWLLLDAGEPPTHAAIETLALVVGCFIVVIFFVEGGKESAP